MNKNDIQFTYVITSLEYRGQGIAAATLQIALSKFSNCYVTDTEIIHQLNYAQNLGLNSQDTAKNLLGKVLD